jgi:hypothetical protein
MCLRGDKTKEDENLGFWEPLFIRKYIIGNDFY